MRIPSLLTWLFVLALAALVAAGCGGDGDDRDGDEPSGKAKAAQADDEQSHDDEEADAHDEDEAKQPAAGEDEPHPKAADASFDVKVRGASVVGGPQSFEVRKGDHVRISISADEADEAHLHGIDAEAKIPAGGTGELEFQATEQGSYELELHESGVLIGTVVVK